MLKNALRTIQRGAAKHAAIYRGGRGTKAGVVSGVVETAEYAGFSAGFGYLQQRYDKKLLGMPLDAAVGLVAKALAIGADVTSKGSVFSPHLHTLGNAGIGAYCHTLGAGLGNKASGRKRILLPPGAAVPSNLPAGSTVLGDLPPAPAGDFLSKRDLARLAAIGR